MTDKNYSEFLEITGASRSFVEDINDLLLDSKCKREIKTSKSGFFGYASCKDEKRNYKSVFLQAACQSK